MGRGERLRVNTGTHLEDVMGHARVGETVPEVRWLVADEAMRQDVGCNPYRVGSVDRHRPCT